MADDFVDAMFAQPVSPEPEPAPQPEAAVEPTPETVEEPAPVPEPQPEPEQRGPGYVPIDAMLTERERRQAVERERDEARRELEAARQKPQTIPDSFDDPEGYNAYLRGEMQQALQAQKVDMSWAFAVRQHGEDTVKAAKDWALERAQRDPGFRSMLDTEFASQPLPIDWIVQQHKRDALLSEVGDNVDDWFTREAAKRGYAPQSAPSPAAPIPVAATPAPKPAMPPRSIASDATPTRAAPSENPMATLDAIFNRR